MPLTQRLKSIRKHLGKNQKEMAKLVGASHPSWQGYELGRTMPGGKVFEALAKAGFNATWLLTGEGEMFQRKGYNATNHTVKHVGEQRPAYGEAEDLNIQGLLNMTAEVLVSDTLYRPALAANIKAFHRSIALEQDNQELKNRVEKLETERLTVEKRMTVMEKNIIELKKRKGCENPHGYEEESLKKKAI